MRPLGQRTGVLLLAFAMFVVTMSLRFFATPEDAVLTLLTVPVAVIAFEFGWRAGVVAAVVATVWVVVWNQLYLSPLGYFARGATYVLTALVVGLFADRLRAAQAAAMESERRLAELQLERQEQVAAATAERERLAREVHDVIAHSVSVMTVQSTAARRVMDRDHGRAAAALEAIERTGREALAELRRVLSVLRPAQPAAALSPQRGIEDLEGLAEQIRVGRRRRDGAVRGKQAARAGCARPVGLPDRAGGAHEHAQACRGSVCGASSCATATTPSRSSAPTTAPGRPRIPTAPPATA